MKDSNIQWTDHTFNAWEGCEKISHGCLHCYAETRNHRFGHDNWGPGKPRLERSDAYWREPLKWDRDAKFMVECGVCGSRHDQRQPACEHHYKFNRSVRPRVFCASLSDWLDAAVPIEWLARLLTLIYRTPNLDWLLLTKRPENWISRVTEAIGWDLRTETHGKEWNNWLTRWANGHQRENVWIGTTVEDQKRADERIPELLKIPAKVRFLSVEPMLENILLGKKLLRPWIGRTCTPDQILESGIHWAIFGGESGPQARPCNVDWIRDGVRQCREACVPVFVKQLGANVVSRNDAGFEGESPTEWPMDTHYTDLDPMEYQGAPVRVKLKHSKGGAPSEWPEELRIQEWPCGAGKDEK